MPTSVTHVPVTATFLVLVAAARCACWCYRLRDRVQKSEPNLKLKECVPNLVVSKQPDKASTSKPTLDFKSASALIGCRQCDITISFPRTEPV